jgi:hypothetical protein
VCSEHGGEVLQLIARLGIELDERTAPKVATEFVQHYQVSRSRERRRNSDANTTLPYEMKVTSASDGKTYKIEHNETGSIGAFDANAPRELER